MNTEILSVLFIFLLIFILGIPFGKYISKVFKNEKTLLDFLAPLENLIFKFSGIDPDKEMDWKQNIKAMLTINFIWFIWAILVLSFQNLLFWNPDNIPGMEPTQAFNTAVSFMTNTNLQHYSGETGVSYLSQLIVMCFLQFVSAGTGIAVAALMFKGLANKSGTNLGNFYNLMLKSCTRILLPVSVVVALILMFNGIPMTFKGAENIVTLQGDTVSVARGPAAPMVGIKQLGTNGGGFFGTNSAHPFENPNFFTNIIELVSILFIPVAMIIALGYYLNRKKLSYMIFGVMLTGYVCFLIPAIYFEMNGNPEIDKMGISQPLGNMEGKEVRFGSASSAMWGVSTTVTSNGSVNSMHDSFTPITGMILMLGMQLNAFFGGVGVGFLNKFVFIILAVFISGLMVGRTPEFLGKKIEGKEIKIAIIVALMHPLLILAGTAIAAHIWLITPIQDNFLNNPSYHGFSEMFYEFSSAAANNGSGFEGLIDNTPFWNISTGIVILLGRFIPIIGPVAIAGLLSAKKFTPESAGSLKIDSPIFGIVLLSTIVILGALLFFPGLALGPVSEFFSMAK
ncbi:MAG TPA: potassium-transporting ATPase subunit KdpA [Ignavibacteria bacterium]|nr:potassium-transporting ATPase subunit KdpA [Ignavibacteria bacterium]